MPCVYNSVVSVQFTDAEILRKAFERLGWTMPIVTVRDGKINLSMSEVRANMLKTAYGIEAAKATAKRRGYFVTETRDDRGRVQLKIQK